MRKDKNVRVENIPKFTSPAISDNIWLVCTSIRDTIYFGIFHVTKSCYQKLFWFPFWASGSILDFWIRIAAINSINKINWINHNGESLSTRKFSVFSNLQRDPKLCKQWHYKSGMMCKISGLERYSKVSKTLQITYNHFCDGSDEAYFQSLQIKNEKLWKIEFSHDDLIFSRMLNIHYK